MTQQETGTLEIATVAQVKRNLGNYSDAKVISICAPAIGLGALIEAPAAEAEPAPVEEKKRRRASPDAELP